MAEGLLERLPRAARLEGAVFAEAAADEPATGPLLGVVGAAALLEAAGDGGGLEGLLLGLARNALGWGLAVLAIQGAASLLGIARGLAPLFRALALASLPFALGILELLPVLGAWIAVARWAWTLAAFAVATRAALEVEAPLAAGLAAGGLAVAAVLAGALT